MPRCNRVIVSAHNPTAGDELKRRCSEEAERPFVLGQAPWSPLSPCQDIISHALITLVILLRMLSSCQYPLELWRGELHSWRMPAAVMPVPKADVTEPLLFSWNFPFCTFRNVISPCGQGIPSELTPTWWPTANPGRHIVLSPHMSSGRTALHLQLLILLLVHLNWGQVQCA